MVAPPANIRLHDNVMVESFIIFVSIPNKLCTIHKPNISNQLITRPVKDTFANFEKAIKNVRLKIHKARTNTIKVENRKI